MGCLRVCISQHKIKDFGNIVFLRMLFRLLDNPIGKDSIGMGPYHAASGSLGKGPLWHVASLSIYEHNAHRDISESIWVMQQNPRHLGPMYIPYRHICVDVLHIGWLDSCTAIVFEG